MSIAERDENEIYLRPLSEKDLESMKDWERDTEIREFFGLNEPGDGPTYRDRCLSLMGKSNHRMWAIKRLDHGFIGEIELTHINWKLREAELKVCIGKPQYRGLGLGTAAIRLVLDEAFDKLRLDKVYLRVYQYNKRAIRCYLGLGFKKEAVLRNRYRHGGINRDIYLMYINSRGRKKELRKM